MVKHTVTTVLILLCLTHFFSECSAQEPVRISGLFFGDYFFMANSHNEKFEGENAFWIRRLYLRFDKDIDEKYAIRVNFEIKSPGDFVTESKMNPTVRDAYLRRSFGRHALYAGISVTPLYRISERFWGYRAVELPASGLQRFGASRDFGLSLRGSFLTDDKFTYHLMLANGNAQSSEVGQGKKVYASLAYWPDKESMVEFYSDYDNRAGDEWRATYQISTGVIRDTYRLGFQAALQQRMNNGNPDDDPLRIISVFGSRSVHKKIWGILRYDRIFDANPEGESFAYFPFDATAGSHFVIAGFEYKLDEKISLIPNVEAVYYNKNGAGIRPDTDIMPRMTLYFVF